MSASAKVYVVRRVPHYDQDQERRQFQRAFGDWAAAVEYCREATAAARRRQSPMGVLWGQMVMNGGTERLAAAVRELGLPPSPVPTDDGRALYQAFVAWWKAILPQLTPELTERLWEVGQVRVGGYDSTKLYEVVEVPLEGS